DPPMQLAARPRGPAAARGLVLTDGTFLPGATRAADDRRVTFVPHGATDAADVPLSGVAIVALHPLGPAAAATTLNRTAAGVLMLSGDFADGDCRQIADGKVNVSSVLVGEKTFDVATQVAAAVYHEVKPSGAWVVHTSAEGAIRAKAFHIEA